MCVWGGGGSVVTMIGLLWNVKKKLSLKFYQIFILPGFLLFV